MPVSVIRSEDAKLFARNTVYDQILLNPAIGPGIGETNSGGQEFDAGVAYINLRNLGVNRSLVLVDGQRWVSGGARTSAVDLNTIPSALIDRIEVVTGGAAAIYGADAVSGAVNIIMKKNVRGLQLSGTTGISGHGDARQTNFTLATGADFGGGRGHFVFGGDVTDTAGLDNLDRYAGRPSYYVNPANTGPNDGIPDNLLATNTRQLNRSSVPAFCLPQGAGCQQWYQLINGVVTPVPSSSYVVTVRGETGAQNGGPATAASAYENVMLRARSFKASAYSHLSYELAPDITWGATFSLAHTYNRATPEWPAVRTDQRPTNWWGGTTGELATLTNPYLPDSLRQFMLANGLTQINLDRTYLNLPRAYEYHRRNNLTVGSDLVGKLGSKLNWQVYARYGQVTDHITTTNMIGKNEWLAARNTVVNSSGQIVCADPAAIANGCQPLNFFSTDAYSPALLGYLEKQRFERTKNTLFDSGANLNGSIFSLPYGDLSVAAGVEWRRETLKTRDDPDLAKLADIIYSPGADYARHPNLDAARNTAEVYGEAVVPLLAKLPFAERLELEGAYRYSHYSDTPSTKTWKLGGTWEPVSGLTFRGVYSKSVRVPNFGELYSPNSTATFGQIQDPCQAGFINQNVNRTANCRAIMPGVTIPLPTPNLNAPVIFSGGNPNLTPERSKSYTLGAVFQPRLIHGLDFTVDYWNIKIDNAITSLPFTTILNSCVDSPGGPNQAYCQLVTRDAQGNVVNVRAQFANLASQQARGIDLTGSYRSHLLGGSFRASLTGSYRLKQLIVAQVGKAGIDFAGEWDYPHVRASLLTEYTRGPVTLGVETRFISKSKFNVTAASAETFEFPNIPAYVYNDVTLTYRPSPRYSIGVGVKNLSDVKVPLELQMNAISPHLSGGAVAGGGSAGYYDAIGRYFFVRATANF
jgi:outer membrane receptor protein involved in Fe transport